MCVQINIMHFIWHSKSPWHAPLLCTSSLSYKFWNTTSQYSIKNNLEWFVVPRSNIIKFAGMLHLPTYTGIMTQAWDFFMWSPGFLTLILSPLIWFKNFQRWPKNTWSYSENLIYSHKKLDFVSHNELQNFCVGVPWQYCCH